MTRGLAVVVVSLLLLTAPVGAVPVRSATSNVDGFTIVTSAGDTLRVQVLNNGGGSFTANVIKNGVTTATQTAVNPTVAQIETFVQTNLGAITGSGAIASVCINRGTAPFNLAVHVSALSPLSILLRVANCDSPIPSNWWQP